MSRIFKLSEYHDNAQWVIVMTQTRHMICPSKNESSYNVHLEGQRGSKLSEGTTLRNK